MTRRMIAVALATTVLALLLAAAAPRAEAVSFVDKQVQAGALLIQKYINDYGQDKRFVYPPKSMVKKGGGLPGSASIWPSNPWTGRIMAPGTARGTYTYTPSASGATYRFVVHLSSGNWTLSGGVPAWFKPERNTAARQNLLLLQRYLDAYKAAHADYPATGSLTPETFPSPTYVWPRNPWTGAAMAASDTLGDFSYARVSATDFTLKVKLTSGWSEAFGPVRCWAGSRRRRVAESCPGDSTGNASRSFHPCSGHDLIDPDPRLTEAGIVVAGPIFVGGKPCTAVSFRPSCSRSPAHS